ncbi:MAG: hypothetical protein WA667_25965 [Candidatus Nitrosopolaris sp.]
MIGNVLKTKRVIKEEDICTEIKNALYEEIKEKIISSDTIERCCPDEWKRKTKPKDSMDPILSNTIAYSSLLLLFIMYLA